MLVDKGMLVRKRGVGTQVVHAQVRRTVELTSLNDDLSARASHPSTVSSRSAGGGRRGVGHAPEPCRRAPPLWELQRVRHVDDEPLALMRNHVPEAVIDLSRVDFSETGLYECFRAVGIHLRVAHQTISARLADTREAS